MKLDFDFGNVPVTEFGVGWDDGDDQSFTAIPVDEAVQAALHEMVASTLRAMQQDQEGPTRYEPSDKHGPMEYLYIPINDRLAGPLRELHEAVNLPINSRALADPTSVFCYYVRLTDNDERQLTALRRATQFKGVLKSRLIRVISDALKLVDDQVFKLDNDFDLLIDSKRIHILRPSGFESLGRLQKAILDAVPTNVAVIQKDLKFVNFDRIGDYAAKHPRAARYLASIRAQNAGANINKVALKKLCKDTFVEIKESKGKIVITDGHEMGFLEVLDRRRYEVKLVKDAPERYKAASRQKING